MKVDETSEAETLTRDASRWLTQLISGEATAADAEALTRWRRESASHEAAFVEAVRVWKSLECGGRTFVERGTGPTWSGRRHQLTRRLVLGGGGALAAAAAGYAVMVPPLGLWPSFDELRANYRTATGEQRHVALAGVAIQMNTQTSIAVSAQGDGMDHLELITGEASFAVLPQSPRSFTVLAGSGRTVTRRARFDVRNVGSAVCVTCTDGQVEVLHGRQTVEVVAGSQLTYNHHGLGQSHVIDAAEATAWQDGFIVFRNTPLSAAVAELNRYRRGRVILLNAALEEMTVSGRFRIDRIDEILTWIEEVTGARPQVLPAGIILLS
ncbi:MAG: FecR domain-containing protein [Xanthobacteraceae bacterium]|nr:FecR domain-containing protein [Xanthobacteraceae bacterium]